jgi:beta-glucosidase
MKKTQITAKLCGAMTLLALSFQCLFPIASLAATGSVSMPKNYYNSEYDSYAEVLANGDKIEQQAYAEGIVMLKNENNALPIPEGSKISVFSKNSNDYKIREYLSSSGYSVNPTLANFYKDSTLSGAGRGTAPGNGQVSVGYNTGETPVSMYRDVEKNSFKDYNDAAIVVIHRMSGEGNDAPRTMMWNEEKNSYAPADETYTDLVPGARQEDDHYLQLDQNETDMLEMVAQYFDKIVVIFFTPSSFETGFLDDPGHYAYQENIKAALYIGYPYTQVAQTNVLGEILQGKINPSGRLVDTWARDFKLDPTWENFGNYLDEGKETKGNSYTNVAYGAGSSKGSYYNNYVTYNEGIYVGYRYWETRGYTEGTGAYSSAGKGKADPYFSFDKDGDNEIHGTTTTEWSSWYDSRVVFPYGYGLSYTTFTQEIVSSSPENLSYITSETEIKVQVKVTNTGSVVGKEVIQLYYTAPYYTGGIEKAHVVLATFGKTDMLAPGESQTLTLSFSARDMASYDYSDANGNGFRGYELESGTYVVRLMKNAHEEWENLEYNVASTEKLRKDAVTGNDVVNRFDEVSNYITEDLGQQYLSRSDWEGTWPVFNFRLTASQAVIDGLEQWKYNVTMDPELDKSHPLYTTVMPTTGAKNGLVLSDLNGLDYDDPLWEQYLDQLTQQQLIDLCTKGHYECGINVPELGLKNVGNYDTRGGLYNRDNPGTNSRVGDIIIVAQTFNLAICYEFGKQIGEEALWDNTKLDTGNEYTDVYGSGAWYAPSVNIHRSQFLGRNQQYYGEDPYLAGKMAAQIVIGAQEKGFATYVKHFAINNQETNRIGLSTWCNEQAMREVYFKAFEITVKEGKTLGIMSALNRIGTEWAGGSYDLLTGVLRDEWGFRGCVVTDSFIGNFSNVDQMIRAGGNLSLGNVQGSNSTKMKYNLGTPTTVNVLRDNVHGILYMMANSNAINSYSPAAGKPVESFTGSVLNPAMVGISYTASVATAKISNDLFPGIENSAVEYSLSEGASLPAGLTLSRFGIISGVPEEEINNLRFSVDASYAGYTRSATFTLTVVGGNGAIVYQVDDANLGTFLVGSSVDLSVAYANVYKPEMEDGEVLPVVSYSLKSGSILPDGLSLSSDGKITGTLNKECTNYEFTVVASADGYRSVEHDFSISAHYSIDFQPAELTIGKVGISYTAKLGEAMSENSVIYKLADGSSLPQGLSLTEGGFITGKPMKAVTDHAFTVEISAPFAETVSVEYKITIGLNYGDFTLLPTEKGVEYFAYVNTAQGGSNVTYALKSGNVLPEGLTLSSDGVISGTTDQVGIYEITIVASEDGLLSDEITVSLYVVGTSVDIGIDMDSGNGGKIEGKTITTIIWVSFVAGLAVVAIIWIKKRGIF